MSSPSIKRNFAYNVAYQVLALVLPLVTSPYLSRVVGPEGMGTYSYTFSIAYYFVMFAMLGVNNYGNREVARERGDRAAMSRTFWEIWALQLCLGVVAVAVYLAYALGTSGSAVAIVWALYVASSALDVNWLFFGLEEFQVTVGRNFVVKIVTFVLTFVVVRGEGAVLAYCALMSASLLMSVLVLWPFVRGRVDWARPTVRGIISHVPGNLVLFVPVVAISLYTVLDRVMLGHMSTMSETGYFENALKLSQMPFTLVAALGTVMLPRMSALISQGRKAEGERYLGLSMRFAMALSLALSLGLAGVAPVFAPVFFGGAFAPAAPVIVVLMVNMPFMAWANVLRTQYLIPAGRDRAYVLSVIVGAVVNVAVNLLAIPAYGAIGAAWGSTAAEVAVCAVQVFAVSGELPQRGWVWACAPYAVAGVIMFAVVRAIGGALGVTVSSLATQVVVGGLVYAALCWCWMAKTGDELYVQVVRPAAKGLLGRLKAQDVSKE